MSEYFIIRHKQVPAAGLGTTVFWGNSVRAEKAMQKMLQEGKIRMLDCAEMYGYGRCESTVGRILKKTGRENIFLIDKVLPENAVSERLFQSFERSCRRLGTDYIDLYLLHWREHTDLAFFVKAMEELKRQGRIGEWGVSNFDVKDMEDLFLVDGGENCFCDQVLYNLGERGIEYDLLPWLEKHEVLPMAYSSLGSGWSSVRNNVSKDIVVREICQKEGITPEALMLSFVIHQKVSAVFSSSSYEHIIMNLKGSDFDIRPYMEEMNARFRAPDHKVPLAKL